MNKELSISTKGMNVFTIAEEDSNNGIVSIFINRWIRKLEYKLIFQLSKTLEFELNKIINSNNWLPLEDTNAHRLENYAWKSLGFQRKYKLKDLPLINNLKTYQKIKMLGISQSETRESTKLTNVWIGQRQGHHFALLHMGHYFSSGLSNMSGSSPTTMVIPIDLLKKIIN